MRKILQSIIQIGFLVLFVVLIMKGKAQLWMGLLVIGIIVSFLLGRLYCGWICSINTVLKPITWIKKKLKIKSLNPPKFLTNPWVRYIALALFVAVFIFTLITGKKLPVLPVLFGVGILLTLVFEEELWHHYLCPYGTIMHFPATKATYFMRIDTDLCNNCGACMRACPSKAIIKDEKNHQIIKNECLVCMKCTTVCRQNAISYQ